jgi:hypothetical protein
MIRDIRSNGPVNTEQNYLIIVEIVEFPHFLYFFIFKNVTYHFENYLRVLRILFVSTHPSFKNRQVYRDEKE